MTAEQSQILEAIKSQQEQMLSMDANESKVYAPQILSGEGSMAQAEVLDKDGVPMDTIN